MKNSKRKRENSGSKVDIGTFQKYSRYYPVVVRGCIHSEINLFSINHNCFHNFFENRLGQNRFASPAVVVKAMILRAGSCDAFNFGFRDDLGFFHGGMLFHFLQCGSGLQTTKSFQQKLFKCVGYSQQLIDHRQISKLLGPSLSNSDTV